ncbi:peptidoglycan-binding protein [Dactylosporangium sp. NPDC005555]|uniref:peptidoglycan-binding protein n=1 Tax=Dactylosporangium sp. NPDC005555 TaxID=3154889 RepID=UPI0033BB2299
MSRRRSRIVSAVTAAGVAGVAGVAGFVALDGPDRTSATPQEAAASAATAQVRRGDVAERRWVNGTLGYAGEHVVVAPAPGTLTRLPVVGSTVGRGGAVYDADGLPVILLYGGLPPWRSLQAGMTDGADVEQLESNLVQLGHGAGVTVDRHFTAATAQAVRRWQRATGLPVTGSVPLGQVVFAPEAVRVGGTELVPGAQVQPGGVVLRGTGGAPAVTFLLVPRQLPTAKAGDAVAVTLPDGTTRDGTIVSIGAVTVPTEAPGSNGGNNQPTATVTVRVDGAITGFMDQTQVQVAVTVAARTGVLAVPVTALNPVAGGTYQVVVLDGGGTHRIDVTTGLFDERTGLVEVDGPGLTEGQQVRVPRATS